MATLQEIANKLNLNVSVVSRALNPNPDKNAVVKKETRELIQRVAKELGYRPNRQASFLKKGRNSAILCYLPDVPNDLIANLMFGISEAANQENFPLNFVFGNNPEDFRSFVDSAAQAGNSGVLSYPPQKMPPAMQEMVKTYLERGGKMLLLNVISNTPHSGEVPPGFENVPQLNIDDYYGGALMARHFLEQGCRKFYFFYDTENLLLARYNGYVDTVHQAGFAVEAYDFYGSWSCLPATEKIGIFAHNDLTALELYRYLENHGVTPGKQVLLGGFNGMLYAQKYAHGITTVVQPMRETGVRAVQKLIRLLFGKVEVTEQIRPYLVIRPSSGGELHTEKFKYEL